MAKLPLISTEVDQLPLPEAHWTLLRGRLLSADLTRRVASRVALLMIVGVGALLRLWDLDRLGFNSDEVVYASQGAAIAADPVLKEFFPIFRAHPLLFQLLVSLGYTFGEGDLVGRACSALVGLLTIYVVALLGEQVYGRTVGLVAALFIALMPYHVGVTRQVLLDGSLTLFTTLSLYMLARFARTGQPPWLYAAGVGMGLAFLAKETGVVLLGSIYAFLALCPQLRVRLRDLVASLFCMAVVMAPHFVAVSSSGRSKTAQQYVLWQLFRRPNHEWSFYPTLVPMAMGPLVVVAALLGLWLLRRERSWREVLLLAWIAVPSIFFQLWPTKGFQYLLPAAPAVAVLAARAVCRLGEGNGAHSNVRTQNPEPGNGWCGVVFGSRFSALGSRLSALGSRFSALGSRLSVPKHERIVRRLRRWAQPLAIGLIASSLALASWHTTQRAVSDTLLAGGGGMPGGRETGEWVRRNVPEGARFLTMGPSMANIIQFYGHRRAYGLSVSANPLRRNPVYQPVPNPSAQIRDGEIQYIVYDSFTAGRSPYYAQKLLDLVRRFNGRAVHSETITLRDEQGAMVVKPVIVVYEVRP